MAWKRPWQHYDDEMSVISSGSLDSVLRAVFPLVRERLYWKRLMRRVYEGRINSGEYRWELSCWAQSMFGIMPTRNLVTNRGFESDATHTANRSFEYEWDSTAMDFPLRHPDWVHRDFSKDQQIENTLYSKDLRTRARWAIGRLLRQK